MYLGPAPGSNQFNAPGYGELRSVKWLHDQILALNRGGWYKPPANVVVHDYHQAAMRHIVNQLARRRLCGVKDPRTLLMLDAWETIIGSRCHLIGTFRHPLAVAASLNQRNGIPVEQGLTLWRHYNQRLVERHQKTSFPLVEFNLHDVNAYCGVVTEVATQSGLKPHFMQLRRFVRQPLEHHKLKKQDLPVDCAETYAYLMDNRKGGSPERVAAPSFPGDRRWQSVQAYGKEVIFRNRDFLTALSERLRPKYTKGTAHVTT